MAFVDKQKTRRILLPQWHKSIHPYIHTQTNTHREKKSKMRTDEWFINVFYIHFYLSFNSALIILMGKYNKYTLRAQKNKYICVYMEKVEESTQWSIIFFALRLLTKYPENLVFTCFTWAVKKWWNFEDFFVYNFC